MKLSVIIPALNEAENIGAACLSAAGAHEVIVADGGSVDGTVELARSLGARVIETERGRGAQMDAGAAVATGDAFVFLHADTTLPEGWARAVEAALGRNGVAAGAFCLAIGSPRSWFRFIEAAVSLRCRALGLVYGDQALFASRDAFFRAGGFNRLPLMEDVDCVKRLRRLGGVELLREAVTTSPRRWESRGLLGASVANIAMLLLYHAGVSPRRLRNWYYGPAPDRARLDRD